MQAFGHLALVASTPEMRTVAPMRKPNAKYRSREHLTEREVEKLIDAAKDNRWGHQGQHNDPACLQARPEGRRAG